MKKTNLHSVLLLLEATEQLYTENIISKEAYNIMLTKINDTYSEPESITKKLVQFGFELLSIDKVENHFKVLTKLKTTFLESNDADEREDRLAVLELLHIFEELLSDLHNYDRTKLMNHLITIK